MRKYGRKILCNNFRKGMVFMGNDNIWYGKGKIAFTKDDWKISASEVTGHFLTADINKIKKDKIILDGDSTQNE